MDKTTFLTQPRRTATGTDGLRSPSSASVVLPPYHVQDHRVPAPPPMDAWAEYIRSRYAVRQQFYDRQDASEQEHMHVELRRIRYFRNHFRDYRISSVDRLPLVAMLDDSRSKWRDIASRRAASELAKCLKEIEKHGETANRARNRTILQMVVHWGSKAYADRQNAHAPEAFMPEYDSMPDSSDDNPSRPNYGYNGWILVWDEEKGGVNMEHPQVHGQFPHQKISMQQLLYNESGTPLKRTSKKGQYRYFHLPANSMKWVEDAISRYYDESNVEFDSRRILTMKSNAQRLLRNELWRGQQRGGDNLPAHARQIGSRCSATSSAPLPRGEKAEPGPRKDIALFMPYLHWEVEKRLHRMSQFVQVAKSRKDHTERLRRASTSRYKGRTIDLSRIQAQVRQPHPDRPVTGFEEEDEKPGMSWRPQNPLARYIWYAAKLFQIVDEAADGRLIEDHLFSPAPLHMRRTLEQFYYWTADDTTHRDRDQVACRATRVLTDDPDDNARIVMVDQLWLWILDDNTVITSFPRRWGRNKPDPSAVHRGVRDRLAELDDDEIHSVYDLAFIIIDECSKVFFDRTKPIDQRPDVVDLFSSAISNIADNKTLAYQGFGDAVSKISIDHHLDSVEKRLRRSLNIGFEWSILVEAQQVIDELQIMQEIFSQQLLVMRDFERILKSLSWEASKHKTYESVSSSSAATPTEETPPGKVRQMRALDRLESVVSDIEQRREELASMERLQTKTRGQLRELLDMKQQQANVIEAKAAIQRADESVLQGRSIVVFTVVTIFFLPLSFFATVFGMNNKEMTPGGASMTVGDQMIYMFAISFFVISISLAIAFSTWMRTVLQVSFSMFYVTIEEWMGWRNKKSNYNSTALKNRRLAKLQQIESRHTARRLTEISSRTRDVSPVSPLSGEKPPEVKRTTTWGSLLELANGGPLGRFRGKRSSLASDDSV